MTFEKAHAYILHVYFFYQLPTEIETLVFMYNTEKPFPWQHVETVQCRHLTLC